MDTDDMFLFLQIYIGLLFAAVIGTVIWELLS